MPRKIRKVLFICLGNICRSPIAEGILRHLVTERGQAEEWMIDSAAIGDYHIGSPPDARALAVLHREGVAYNETCRLVRKKDFTEFDLIFGMDHQNLSDLEDIKPKNATAKIMLLGSYDPEKQLIIEDPYYGQASDFDTVYTQCYRCCKAFLDAET